LHGTIRVINQGLPKTWRANDDVAAANARARREAVRVLGLLAVCRLPAWRGDVAAVSDMSDMSDIGASPTRRGGDPAAWFAPRAEALDAASQDVVDAALSGFAATAGSDVVDESGGEKANLVTNDVAASDSRAGATDDDDDDGFPGEWPGARSRTRCPKPSTRSRPPRAVGRRRRRRG
jgi:hypothetical protein